MPAIRNRGKVRATAVSIRLSDQERDALYNVSTKNRLLIADMVTDAVRAMWGKEMDQELFLASDEQNSSTSNRKEQTA